MQNDNQPSRESPTYGTVEPRTNTVRCARRASSKQQATATRLSLRLRETSHFLPPRTIAAARQPTHIVATSSLHFACREQNAPTESRHASPHLFERQEFQP